MSVTSKPVDLSRKIAKRLQRQGADTVRVIQRREEFHKLIDTVEDPDILEMFFQALTEASNRKEKNDILDDLTAEQQPRLQESLLQAMRNETIPDEIMKSRVQQLLGK
jgi:hypothetical protein